MYKNDDLDQGVRLFWYGLSPQCSDTENSFDVRDVASALGMPQPSSLENIAAVIRAAIDRALEGRPEECGSDFARCWEGRNEDPGPETVDILAELITPEVRSALVGVLEFCNFAKDFGFAGEILDEMDLSDDAFEEILSLLERLVN
ncbi:hypothetical protein [Thermanaeromonas toyohensis]|uniref:hypothetical protein n=1 Tax=Thermanaeromonas toyohensis TaxID=161154 RepID=UPI0012F49754|nr:hypothetical protein [Thermanaeromonas toyohensis]